MKKVMITLAILLLFISGCGTLDKKTVLLNIGDSKRAVLDIMGTPMDRQVNGYQEAWQYCITGAGFDWNDHKIIWFDSGRVTGINSYRTSGFSCRGGIRPVRWNDAPDYILEIR